MRKKEGINGIGWIIPATVVALAASTGFFCGFKFSVLAATEIAALFAVWCLLRRCVKKSSHISMIKQAAFVLSVAALFLFAALVSPSTDKSKWKWIVPEVLAVFGLLAVCLDVWRRKGRRTGAGRSVKELIITYKYELILIGLVCVTRIWMFGTLQRWDAGEYYGRLGNACEAFDFTPAAFFEHFRLASHPTLGYAGIMAIGEFFDPRGTVGMLAVNLALTAAAVVCIYRMFYEKWSDMSKGKAFFGAAACMLLPLFWSGFSFMVADYGMAVFFIFVMYADHKKQYLLFLFWAAVLCQTKETGIVVFAGYMLGRLVCQLAGRGRSVRERLKGVVKDSVNWCAAGAALLMGIYMVLNGGFSDWKQHAYATTTYGWDGSGNNTFGIRPDYILVKLKQLFVVNFSWLIWLAVAVGLIVYLARKSKGKAGAISGIGGMAGAMAAFALFSCLYITTALYRYNTIFVITSWMLCYLLLESLLRNRKAALAAVTAGCCVLFGWQMFATVDPVSRAVSETVDTGTGEMLLLREKSYGRFYGDHLFYNYQYTWIDRALDAMLKETEYEEGDTVILAGNQTAVVQVGGNSGKYTLYWDESGGRRTPRKTESAVKISTIGSNSVAGLTTAPSRDDDSGVRAALEKMGDRAVVFFLPFFDIEKSAVLEQLGQYYYIGEEQIYEESWGAMPYYRLLRKADAGEPWEKNDTVTASIGGGYAIEEDGLKVADYRTATLAGDVSLSDEELHRAVLKDRKKDGKEPEKSHDRIEEGDTAAIAFGFYEDGAFYPQDFTFDGKRNKTVQIGAGGLVDGVEEALIGARAGETVRVECTFPDDYANDPHLAGKTVQLDCEILFISETLPELTDEWVRNNRGCETVKEYEEKIRTKALMEKLERNWAGEKLLDAVADNSSWEGAAAEHADPIGAYARKAGISRERLVKEFMKLTKSEETSYNMSIYNKRALYGAVVDAIIEKEGILDIGQLDQMSEEELLDKFGERTAEAVKENAAEEYLLETAVSNLS